MKVITDSMDLIRQIKQYANHNWIWIEIWNWSHYEIQIVVTVNHEEMCHLGRHKVFHLCSADPTSSDDVIQLKAHGKFIAKLLRKTFPEAKVHSRLYYK